MAETDTRHLSRRNVLAGGAALSVLSSSSPAQARSSASLGETKFAQTQVEGELIVNKTLYRLTLELTHHSARRSARSHRAHGVEEGLRPRPMWRLHRARRRQARALLSHARRGRSQARDHDRRHRLRNQAAPPAGGVYPARRLSMRLLHARADHVWHRLRERRARRQRCGSSGIHERQSLPLRGLSAHRRCNLAG